MLRKSWSSSRFVRASTMKFHIYQVSQPYVYRILTRETLPIQEQQRLLQEYESRLQTVEKEKYDTVKLVAQLEDKLQIQEEK